MLFTSLFLFSCSNYLIQAKEIKPENLKCRSTSAIEFFEKNGLFITKDKDFDYKLKFFNKNLNRDDFNLIYISQPQSSGGYVLKAEKIIKNKDKHEIYFKENKPPKGSNSIAAISTTYCFLKIKNLDKVEVIIR